MSQPLSKPRAAQASSPAKVSAGGVKKARNQGAKIITANDLFTGAVIYWTDDYSWTEDITRAMVCSGERAMAALEQAVADEACAVGPYLMDVDAHGKPAGRGRLRETIRDAGPTIHPSFGRQAEKA